MAEAVFAVLKTAVQRPPLYIHVVCYSIYQFNSGDPKIKIIIGDYGVKSFIAIIGSLTNNNYSVKGFEMVDNMLRQTKCCSLVKIYKGLSNCLAPSNYATVYNSCELCF